MKIHLSIIKIEMKGRYGVGNSSIHNRRQDMYTNHLSLLGPKDIVIEKRQVLQNHRFFFFMCEITKYISYKRQEGNILSQCSHQKHAVEINTVEILVMDEALIRHNHIYNKYRLLSSPEFLYTK